MAAQHTVPALPVLASRAVIAVCRPSSLPSSGSTGLPPDPTPSPRSTVKAPVFIVSPDWANRSPAAAVHAESVRLRPTQSATNRDNFSHLAGGRATELEQPSLRLLTGSPSPLPATAAPAEGCSDNAGGGTRPSGAGEALFRLPGAVTALSDQLSGLSTGSAENVPRYDRLPKAGRRIHTEHSTTSPKRRRPESQAEAIQGLTPRAGGVSPAEERHSRHVPGEGCRRP